MSSFDYLKVFVNDRLAAAAEEIFGVFKKTMEEYEEELDRQRKLLEHFWKPEIKLNRIELSEQDASKDGEVLSEQQEERSSPPEQCDTETSLIKAEEMDLYGYRGEEDLVLKEEADAVALTQAGEDVDRGEDQILDVNPDEAAEDSALDAHAVHSTEPTTSNLSQDAFVAPYFNTSRVTKPFRCDHCGKGFKCRPYFMKHLRNHTIERSYTCSVCGEKFMDRPSLTIHLRCHRDKKEYSCGACGSRFYNSSALEKHTRIHTNEKPFICTSCGSAFRYRNQLSVHLATHSTEKPYVCQTCRKGFQHMSALRRHRKQHTGEKPYICTTCGKDFIQSSDLTVHIRRAHTGEKPYVCSTCGKGFTISSDLSVHMRKHTGERPYVCITCGKVFKYNSDLRVHIRRTHGDE